jgi:PsbP
MLIRTYLRSICKPRGKLPSTRHLVSILLFCFSLSILFILWDDIVLPVYGGTLTYHGALIQYVSSNDTVMTDGNITGTTATPPPSSPLEGIQIAYPNEWLVNDLGNGTVRFSSPLRTDLMRFTVNVVDLPSSMKNMTLDNLVGLNINASKQQLSNFSLLESNATTMSSENQSAYRIVYTNTNKDSNFPLQFKTMQVFAIRDGQLFTLSYVTEDSQYRRYLPTIENMIDSITFTKKIGAQTA